MAKKRGQPPKAPETKRGKFTVYLSPTEKEEVEEARDSEAPEKRTGAYLRDTAVDHAKKVNEKNRKK